MKTYGGLSCVGEELCGGVSVYEVGVVVGEGGQSPRYASMCGCCPNSVDPS